MFFSTRIRHTVYWRDWSSDVCSSDLRRGLPGYLILFAPHAFVPQRQLQSREPPSLLVFLLISTHFTATLGIPLSSPALKSYSSKSLLRLRSEEHTSELQSRQYLVCRLL